MTRPTGRISEKIKAERGEEDKAEIPSQKAARFHVHFGAGRLGLDSSPAIAASAPLRQAQRLKPRWERPSPRVRRSTSVSRRGEDEGCPVQQHTSGRRSVTRSFKQTERTRSLLRRRGRQRVQFRDGVRSTQETVPATLVFGASRGSSFIVITSDILLLPSAASKSDDVHAECCQK